MAEAPKKIMRDMLAEDPFHPSKVDFEKGMSSAPVFALVLIAANVIVFGWELGTGALKSKEAIIAAGAVYGEKVFSGQGWRLATGMFLHGGFGHLIGNCLALYVLGLASERAWGSMRALRIYFVSGLAASFISAVMQPKPAVGASGAIFGLMGAAIVFFYRYRGSFHMRDRRIGAALLGWGAFQLGLGLLIPYVDNWAHFGGLAAGIVFGFTLPAGLFEKAGPSQNPPPAGL
ncbi:MAG: rhomboid family intramembrane serine protease [Elusimicrobia bacterium]|nr:rhomboid family intramembrane serine protease [Elusimicrobiota bacterium]